MLAVASLVELQFWRDVDPRTDPAAVDQLFAEQATSAARIYPHLLPLPRAFSRRVLHPHLLSSRRAEQAREAEQIAADKEARAVRLEKKAKWQVRDSTQHQHQPAGL